MHKLFFFLFVFLTSFSHAEYSISIKKSEKELRLLKEGEVVKKIPILELGENPREDKEIKGSDSHPEHYRTPHGDFFVCHKNPKSRYYKAFQLSYPSERHAEKALKKGIITQIEYTQIMDALLNKKCPPHSTNLGGLIAVHGEIPEDKKFKRGCIVIKNEHIDELWPLISQETQVHIEW
ncbi:MAG: L,D-transpeptidase [Deltaproteobacteria bacterium]|nr:L,D-transpeptidase [Deltaproteobacteria bacterium]